MGYRVTVTAIPNILVPFLFNVLPVAQAPTSKLVAVVGSTHTL